MTESEGVPYFVGDRFRANFRPSIKHPANSVRLVTFSSGSPSPNEGHPTAPWHSGVGRCHHRAHAQTDRSGCVQISIRGDGNIKWGIVFRNGFHNGSDGSRCFLGGCCHNRLTPIPAGIRDACARKIHENDPLGSGSSIEQRNVSAHHRSDCRDSSCGQRAGINCSDSRLGSRRKLFTRADH